MTSGLRHPEAASTRGWLCPPSPSSSVEGEKIPQQHKRNFNHWKSGLFPILWKKLSEFLSGLWVKFPDGTWCQSLSPEQGQGAAGTGEHWVLMARVTQQGHSSLWHCVPVPLLWAASKHTPPCLGTSSHFQPADSMCCSQGIVSKIPLNARLLFPPWNIHHRQSGQFPSWWLWAKTRDAHEVKFQADEEAERKILQSLCVPEFFFKGVWFRGYFLFIFMELLPKRFSWKLPAQDGMWEAFIFLTEMQDQPNTHS